LDTPSHYFLKKTQNQQTYKFHIQRKEPDFQIWLIKIKKKKKEINYNLIQTPGG